MVIKITKNEKHLILGSLAFMARVIPIKKQKKKHYDLWKKIAGDDGNEFLDAFIAGGKATKVKEFEDGTAIWEVEKNVK